MPVISHNESVIYWVIPNAMCPYIVRGERWSDYVWLQNHMQSNQYYVRLGQMAHWQRVSHWNRLLAQGEGLLLRVTIIVCILTAGPWAYARMFGVGMCILDIWSENRANGHLLLSLVAHIFTNYIQSVPSFKIVFVCYYTYLKCPVLNGELTELTETPVKSTL